MLLVFLVFNQYCISISSGDNYRVYQDFTMVLGRPTIVFLLASVVALTFFWKSANLFWTSIPKYIRVSISILTLLVSWNYVFYDYNYFMNEWHRVDRLLIAALAILSLRYPLFLFPLIAEIYLVDYQFNFPLGGSKLLDKSMPLEMLKMFASWFVIVAIFQSKKPLTSKLNTLFLMFFSLYGFFYFHSGLQKIVVSGSLWSWPFENEIIYNLLAIRDRGWLQNAPQWLVDFHFDYFLAFGTVGQVLVLITELAAIFVLWSKRLAKWLFLGIFILHFHVFVLNGALFWLWGTVGAFLIYALLKMKVDFFSKRNFLISIPLMIVFVFALQVSKLGWYDSRLDNFFELEAELYNGEKEMVSLNTMKPYTLHFQYGNFLSVVDYKNIYSGFLMLNKSDFEALAGVDSSGAMELIESKGVNVYRPEMRQELSNILDSFLVNSGPQENEWLNYFQPPPYWNAHYTDTLPEVKGPETVGITVYHSCVLRDRSGGRTLLWKRPVITREKNEFGELIYK